MGENEYRLLELLCVLDQYNIQVGKHIMARALGISIASVYNNLRNLREKELIEWIPEELQSKIKPHPPIPLVNYKIDFKITEKI